jgi:hypothetical protein
LEYAIRRSKKLERTEIEWDIVFLAYADDVNIAGENINAIKKKHRSPITC